MINTGRPVSTVARELRVKEATLGGWVNLFRANQDAGQGGITESEKAELLRLRKENADLKLDRAFRKQLGSDSSSGQPPRSCWRYFARRRAPIPVAVDWSGNTPTKYS